MRLVAGVLPRLYIREGPGGLLRPSLGENVSRLVRNRDEALAGNIGLGPHDVTDRIESRLRPRMYKGIEFRVAVEADAETVRLEYPIEFGIRADDSRWIIIVRKRAAVSVLVAAEIGRVSQDEINTLTRN